MQLWCYYHIGDGHQHQGTNAVIWCGGHGNNNKTGWILIHYKIELLELRSFKQKPMAETAGE